MLGYGLGEEVGEAPQRIPISDALAQFPQIPVFHPLQSQRTQHLRGGQPTATGRGVLQTPLQILAYPLHQCCLFGDEIRDSLQDRFHLHTLMDELQIGQTELRILGSGHGFSF